MGICICFKFGVLLFQQEISQLDNQFKLIHEYLNSLAHRLGLLYWAFSNFWQIFTFNPKYSTILKNDKLSTLIFYFCIHFIFILQQLRYFEGGNLCQKISQVFSMCVGYLPDSYYLTLFNHSLLNNLPYRNRPWIFLNNILELRKLKINNSALNIKSLFPNFYSIFSMEGLSWENLNPCMIPRGINTKR